MAKLPRIPRFERRHVRLPFYPMRVGLLVCAVVAAFVIMIAHAYFGIHRYVFIDTAIVAIGPILGYLAGLFIVGVTDNNIAGKCGMTQSQLDVIGKKLETKEGLFLTFTSLITSTYVVAYYLSIRTFVKIDQQDIWPLHWGIAIITGITTGFIGYFSVRYAAYVRMTKLFATVLNNPKRKGLAIKAFQKAVFQGAQFYEPPGTVFVTVGITATFLGLAAGLVTLDVPGLIQPPAGPAAATAADPDIVAASLRSFVGCMGLALGVSMLGVMTAMAAQWLRGHGAAEGTEELLARAARPPEATEPPNEAGS